MAKRKHLLTMRQSAAWRLYVGLACLFVGAWMFEQAVFDQGKTPAAPQRPVTATLLLIVGMALIRGWWRIKRRLESIIAEAVAKSRAEKIREAKREAAKSPAPQQSRPAAH
jgi:hypothetical protein